MDCPACQVENPPQANFRFHCGERLVSRDATTVDRLDMPLDRSQTSTARHLRDEIVFAAPFGGLPVRERL